MVCWWAHIGRGGLLQAATGRHTRAGGECAEFPFSSCSSRWGLQDPGFTPPRSSTPGEPEGGPGPWPSLSMWGAWGQRRGRAQAHESHSQYYVFTSNIIIIQRTPWKPIGQPSVFHVQSGPIKFFYCSLGHLACHHLVASCNY